MRRWLVLLFALLLPLQFAWAAASTYCGHESTGTQPAHFGHHFHAHDGEPQPSAGGSPVADADCAACHAGCTPGIAVMPASRVVAASAMPALPVPVPPFTSAPARAPDRPQWLRLV